jgi:Protein of unknown function (DUF4054)
MACLELAAFLEYFPEFASTDADKVTSRLVVACTMIGTCFGDKAGPAHAYLTAHILAVEDNKEKGVPASRAIASINESLSAPSFDTSDAAYATTKYGRLYLMLKATTPVLPMSTALGFSTGCGCG